MVNENIHTLADKIKKAPGLMPSFSSEVPLGLNDNMLSLVKRKEEALPVLDGFLGSKDPRLRKAAVVMLAYIDSEAAEKRLAEALNDKTVRAEAVLSLCNMYMRDPNGAYASENRFLRNPTRALKNIMKYIDDETAVTVDSGYKVYEGPLADLAIASAVRITGLKKFADCLDPEIHVLIGLTPYRLVQPVKEKMRTKLHQLKGR